ncbi:hypothetical protein EROM_090010 [Encephalitozoon romaleae SJ-2008]|uniref:Leucine-rich repeat-containing protein n=1 Tax=Encephalitozoon romaleae (strain SJ-2008) TaxID=1178016 RepID=I7AP80_ENCRO|nr:hypothetical protein EROM_090010 [Encephalitozoon romaleae SJ-2008]AFN83619.1 hypothetical protein EROM_090010 [Encephalitozoon romaleae SJ-2008]
MRLGIGGFGIICIINVVFSLVKKGRCVRLNYSGRNGKQVPREVFDSMMRGDRIIELNISGNKINVLPAYFENLSFMKVLDVSNNELKFLSSSIAGMPFLVSLNLNSNDLTFLPEEITELKYLENLSIRDNQLQELPEKMDDIASLVNLDLANNKLEDLPFGIGGVENLKRLDLEGNLFDTLPPILGYLENIEEIIFTKNRRLGEIPRKLVQMLANSKTLLLLDMRNNNRLREESTKDNVGWRELREIFGSKIRLSQDEEAY